MLRFRGGRRRSIKTALLDRVASVLRPHLLRTVYVRSGSGVLHVHPSAKLQDAILNLASGDITIDEDVFFGHGVMILAASHDVAAPVRSIAVQRSGYNVTIRRGAWLASRVTVVGPCVIGTRAVVAAGSVVIGDVPPDTLVAGVPARVVRGLDASS